MKVPFLDLKAAYHAQKEEIDAAIAGVLDRSDFILGEAVAAFERDFAAYCETPHAVGLASGLDAIKLGLRACGIGPGDEVICPASQLDAGQPIQRTRHSGPAPSGASGNEEPMNRHAWTAACAGTPVVTMQARC